jgi:hypothetical protein
MGTVHQLASASLTAMFAAILFLASHGFVEYRAAKQPAFQRVDVMQHAMQ